ncbi:DUF4142 domain-containing protein [Rhizobium sp. P38BS-XIX]|uniref:DUF4142 domain-containing protein n=1 Tax=Rhizobium sp. P38BS-XIX TaxID=2726740 RepID=UPI0014575A0C|nr:DUF4142 domain-containing protein [Rhizobium sp. P38BS-XIX]NLR97236.1 DUF4142 domain-containing protein [Rhizobium sp. P38BS-XIX]
MKWLLSSIALLTLVTTNTFAEDAGRAKSIDFAAKVSMANMFEIEAAKVELAKGKADDARQFARDMLKDHEKAALLLIEAAKEDGIPFPTSLDAEHQQKVKALQDSDPANLDQAYLSTQLTVHQDALTLFESFSKSGPDGQLRNVAGKIVPDLHMHLTRVEGLTSK